MAYWNWDPSYELGINVIDNQHKKLVQYINELQAALTTKDRDKIASVLVGVTSYTLSHFAFEEQLMAEAGYAMAGPHKKVHESFIATINRYKSSFDEGYNITGQLMAELQIWLTHHIVHDDIDYKECVQKMLEKKDTHSIEMRAESKKKGWFQTLFG
ncbi:MAG: bacteriohemerythrin [Campylobacteraceae bacterium]|jgi:hemerythrin|nr:bacteriohemerythrin [Campylobacteraceae bacterium]